MRKKIFRKNLRLRKKISLNHTIYQCFNYIKEQFIERDCKSIVERKNEHGCAAAADGDAQKEVHSNDILLGEELRDLIHRMAGDEWRLLCSSYYYVILLRSYRRMVEFLLLDQA